MVAETRRRPDRLELLTEAAKTGKGVLPEDVAAKTTLGAVNTADKPTVALSMGVIYLCTNRIAIAQAFFDRVLGVDREAAPVVPKHGEKGDNVTTLTFGMRPMSGATPSQIAFALFGEASLYQSQKKNEEAREHLMASLKVLQESSFHDEILWRLASLALAGSGREV